MNGVTRQAAVDCFLRLFSHSNRVQFRLGRHFSLKSAATADHRGPGRHYRFAFQTGQGQLALAKAQSRGIHIRLYIAPRFGGSAFSRGILLRG
jgi:hypothetical protein